ncbi:hypothetical protein ABI59_12205 [Acidobacteria bacterium Mor1]|nr:hypothetical protein ABI59_12205 [Acidobacteria bacterium Mor1]
MSFGARFGLLIGGIFLVSALTGPLVKVGLDAWIAADPGVVETLHLRPDGDTYDFGRAFRRWFMLVALAAILIFRKKLGGAAMLGMRPPAPRLRWFAKGLAAGLITWSTLLALMVVLGRRTVAVEIPGDWLAAVAGAALAGLIVGWLEEAITRGYLVGGLRTHQPAWLAILISGAFYSILHFMKGSLRVGPGFQPAVGFEALWAHFTPIAEPGVLLPFIGLTLVGLLLGYGYVWSESLPFVVGVHTGWVFLAGIDKFVLAGPSGTGALYGPQGILATPWSWLAILGFLGVFRFWLRPGASRPA